MVKTSTLIVILGVMVLSIGIFATDAEGAGLVWRAVNKAGSLIADLGNVAGGCSDGQVLKWQSSNSTFICAADNTGSGGITSINSQTGASQTLAGTTGNVTVSSTTDTHTFNVGSNVVITGGSAQTITKGLTLNSLTLGGAMNANNQVINSLGTPASATDASRANTLQIGKTLAVGTCADGSPLEYQASNSTWICGTDSGASLTRISGASGAAGADITWQTLTADATPITSTTPTAVMTTTGVGTGTWAFKYTIIYQSAATTTGLGIAVDHTGTNSDFVSTWRHTTTGGAAATGVGDQLTGTVAGQMMEGKSARTDNSVSSTSTGVDTVNAHMMAVMEGIVVVTGSGNLQLKVKTEVSGSAITVQSGTSLELKKIA